MSKAGGALRINGSSLEAPWPVRPDIPDGRGLKTRYDQALAAAADAEDKLEAAETAFEEASQASKQHEADAASLSSEEWGAKAQALEGAKWVAEKYRSVARTKRDEAFEHFETAAVALAQQPVFTDCRRANELLLELAPMAERFEALARDWKATVPDRGTRTVQRDQLIRLLSSMLMRLTGFAASSVPAIEARQFAAEQIVIPTEQMLQRAAEATSETMQKHWLRCRTSDPARYRKERNRRKGGLAVEDEVQPS
jgi:hypothetical protein